MSELERRIALELRATGNRLEGYAAVFDAKSKDLGGFVEIVRPGTFARSLRDGADVVALWDHDFRAVLGRTAANTLRLEEDQRGLRFSIDVPQTQAGRDTLVSVDRGDVTGASFSFKVKDDRWSFPGEGLALRELMDVDLVDVTVTPRPAYPETSVARRHLDARKAPLSVAMAERYLALMEAEWDF